MRIASCWTAIFKNSSSFLSRTIPPQHRLISLNSGIQQGILAETSLRQRNRRRNDSRNGRFSHLDSDRGSAPKDKAAWRLSEKPDRRRQHLSQARFQTPHRRKAIGPRDELGERAGRRAMPRGSNIIPDLDDLNDPDEPGRAWDESRGTKMPLYDRKHLASSPRYGTQHDGSHGGTCGGSKRDSQRDSLRSTKAADTAAETAEDSVSARPALTLRERRKAAISRKFAEATRVKDEQEARVRGAFGAVPDGAAPPRRLPLASAASELVYGRNAIVAALRGARRRIHKLWVCQRAFVDRQRNWHDCRREATLIERLARDAGAEIAFVSRHWLPLMDAVAGYRQHNGLILDASPIPVPQVTSLLPWSNDSNGQYYEVARANVSENGSRQARVRYGSMDGSQLLRRPIVVLLCNVTDVGNLGAICRSAYWYDIDGVVVPKRGSAGPSAGAAKASSGGIEGVNLLSVDDVKGFIKQSKRAGWHIMAAMPPPQAQSITKPKTTLAASSTLEIDVSKPDSGIAKLDAEKAVLLLLGAEDEGVPEKLAELANSYVTMSRSKPDALGVDSLNVGVAAALIFSEFARTRSGSQASPDLNDAENRLF